MAKITIQSIQEQLEPLGWKVISDTYKNLDEELEFQCNEGHKVFTTWKKLRNKTLCPICGKNQYKINDIPILKKKKGVKRILALDQASHITGYALFESHCYGIYFCTVFRSILQFCIGFECYDFADEYTKGNDGEDFQYI